LEKKESGENCFACGFKMALVQKGKATCLESSYSNLIARQQAFGGCGFDKEMPY